MSSSITPRNIRYRMLSTKDDSVDAATIPAEDEVEPRPSRATIIRKQLHRDTYVGSLLFNLGAFALPAIYGTLSKLWIADIDSSRVVTTDVYTYIGVIVEVLNEGLPRAAWSTIGDRTTRTTRSRIGLAQTLIAVQMLLGVLLTVIFVASAHKLAGAFVPIEVRETSLKYVRISSVQAFSSAIEVAVSASTRALDHPDVPLIISSTKVVINIVLDLLLISRFHVGSHTPSINTQAWIRMSCDLIAAACGLFYFLFISSKLLKADPDSIGRARPSLGSLRVLVPPGIWTFFESALRNAIYLWLISGIVSMGSEYATAWGVFNTIRWGVIMVPISSLEQSTLAFVGHSWGRWRAEVGPTERRSKALKGDILKITKFAWISCGIALAVEIPFCLFLSFWGIKSFAFYLSGSEKVAKITQHMWKTIDWCYIFYALNTQIASVLLATTPRWYFLQALGSNLLWMLPWAIAVTRVGMNPENAWTIHSIVFGGSLVFSFFVVSIVLSIWAWMLTKGKIRLNDVRPSS